MLPHCKGYWNVFEANLKFAFFFPPKCVCFHNFSVKDSASETFWAKAMRVSYDQSESSAQRNIVLPFFAAVDHLLSHINRLSVPYY